LHNTTERRKDRRSASRHQQQNKATISNRQSHERRLYVTFIQQQ